MSTPSPSDTTVQESHTIVRALESAGVSLPVLQGFAAFRESAVRCAVLFSYLGRMVFDRVMFWPIITQVIYRIEGQWFLSFEEHDEAPAITSSSDPFPRTLSDYPLPVTFGLLCYDVPRDENIVIEFSWPGQGREEVLKALAAPPPGYPRIKLLETTDAYGDTYFEVRSFLCK